MWVNPKEWVHVGGEWVQVDPGTEPPVPSNALAIPPAAVDGFDTAASFYDSVGVNIHWKPTGPPYTVPANIVADVAELGLRHVRDTVTGSWWSTVFTYYRAGMVLLRNRNANLPSPTAMDAGHPIFQSCHVPGWTGNQPGGFGNDFSFTVEDWYDCFDAGRAHWQPQLSPRVQVPNGTTSNQNATVPNPWNHNDPEIDWSTVGMVTSANEPNSQAIQNLKAWTKEMRDSAKARTSTVAFGGLPAVTEAGVQSNCKVSQVPVVGPSIINNGIHAQVGDQSLDTQVCDLGDNHPYHVGHEPSHEKVTIDLTQNGLSYNGSMASPPSSLKSLPFVFTEWGQISRGIGGIGYPGAHSGYWPTPDDVIAEYMVRALALFKLRGIRRTYFYELYDANNEANNPENNFGLLTYNRGKKQQFYAVRNLLRLIGFSEPSNHQKLNITVSGFVSSGNNDHIGMYSGNGDFGVTGVGQVYHRTQDRLDVFQIQTATEYRVIVMRQVMLWDREPGNWNPSTNLPQSFGNVAAGRKTPNVQNLSLNLPTGVFSQAFEATPTAGGATTPNDGSTWTAKTISSNAVSFQMQGKLKVFRLVP